MQNNLKTRTTVSAQTTASLPSEGLVRLNTLLAIVGLSRTSWLTLVKNGSAPRPVRIGPAKALTAWRVQDIRTWLAEQGGEP